jgi:hypothetical protein
MDYPKYLSTKGIYYPAELKTISKHPDCLQPLYEAFTNSWEAIIDKYGIDNLTSGKIEVEFYITELRNLSNEVEREFVKIVIKDNGIGLDKDNLDRLETLRDPSKRHSNLGTGRVQFLHFFGRTTITSIHKIEDNSYVETNVTLSKAPVFMQNKAILRIDSQKSTDEQDSSTILTFFDPKEKMDEQLYTTMMAGHFKTELLRHFLARFCDNRNSLPIIIIRRFINDLLNEEVKVEAIDVTSPDKEDEIQISFSKLIDKKIVKADKTSLFHIRAFIEEERNLDKNLLTLVSKGEMGSTLPIADLLEKETVDGKRYLFLLSGDYLDQIDTDDRGRFRLFSAQEFKKRDSDPSFFPEEVILKDDIIQETNSKIASLYEEIGKKEQEKQDKISELQEMFLLDSKVVDVIRKKVQKSNTDEDILSMVYKSEMDRIASQDANIKEQVKELKALDPSKPDYQQELKERVSKFVQMLPAQNKNALSKYVARRKLVLELFEKILNNEIEKVRNGGRIDEDILHNLVFKQHSSNPFESDLWLMDDMFLYFKGCSEKNLDKIRINGVDLIKKQLTEEEKDYKERHGRDAGDRRPDILLYPEEGKCIIIELKAPDVDVSDYLNQITRYAMIIHNLSDESFRFKAYYGYLIGEDVDYRSIVESITRYEEAPNLGYIFNPYEPIKGLFGRANGELRIEIIKYSDILKRAAARNKVFIDKLDGIDYL